MLEGASCFLVHLRARANYLTSSKKARYLLRGQICWKEALFLVHLWVRQCQLAGKLSLLLSCFLTFSMLSSGSGQVCLNLVHRVCIQAYVVQFFSCKRLLRMRGKAYEAWDLNMHWCNSRRAWWSHTKLHEYLLRINSSQLASDFSMIKLQGRYRRYLNPTCSGQGDSMFVFTRLMMLHGIYMDCSIHHRLNVS